MKSIKKLFIISLTLCLMLVSLPSCKSNPDTNYALIEMNSGEKIVILLYPEHAPITVENFKKLVNEDFYDGIIFHRVVKDFVIQCGCPEGTGMGGPGYTIKGEFSENGVTNNIKHSRGIVSMARKGTGNDTAGSQFFIVLEDHSDLDGKYAGFGKVLYGMDTVDKIGAVKVNEDSKPLEDVVIKSIRLITEAEYKQIKNA